MRYPLADIFKDATTVGGLPTCTFPPTNFHRIIRRVVIGNGVSSVVNIYVGVLGSVPVETNTQGQRNSLACFIRVPAGQPYFVQWTVAGSPVSSAFARITLERDDNPLVSDVESDDESGWSVNAITFFQVPTGGPPDILLTTEIPAEITARYGVDCIVILMFRLSVSTYVYMVLVTPFGVIPLLAVGTVVVGLVTEFFTISQTFGNPGAFQISQSDAVDVSIDEGINGDLLYAGETIVGVTNFGDITNWTQSTTNPTYGDAAWTGYYVKQGEWVTFFVRVIIGATTTLGTGDFEIELPFAPVNTTVPLLAVCRDSSAGTAFPCVAVTQTSDPHAFRTHVPAGTRVTQINPFTWVAGDVFSMSGKYRVAP